MKVGILGTRGIPNAYGGFEQFAQFLAEGLVKKGHQVWVYNSSQHPYQGSEWNNIQIIHCKDPEHRIGTIGQFVYDFNCLQDARGRNYNILLQLGYTSNSIWHRWWPKHAINVVNMDGLEWKRSKYNKATRQFLQHAEKWAARNGDILIADSIGIQDYLQKKYERASVYIPYGAEVFDQPNESILTGWNLKPRKYYLVIARMEPENNAEMIIRGFLQSKSAYPLVIVGNTSNRFGRYLRSRYEGPSIWFTEGIYDGAILNNLRYFSRLYLHGHSVGGTNPSLLEAMGCSCDIAAHDNPFNRAILKDTATYFLSVEDVHQIFKLASSEDYLPGKGVGENIAKVREVFNWSRIVEDYEKVFLQALSAADR